MRVVIRADASTHIGSGHIMRCLTLADRLVRTGADATFVCRSLMGNMIPVIEARGFGVHVLPAPSQGFRSATYELANAKWLEVPWQQDAAETHAVLSSQAAQIDWLILDHYSLDATWERTMKPYVRRMMVIDDLANRKHECDLLLDQNLYMNPDSRYEGLIQKNCKLLVGPQYTLLRDEFIHARESLPSKDGVVRGVLVFFGGSDPTGETEKALEAIAGLNVPDIYFDVVVGRTNECRERIRRRCEELPNVRYHCQVANMAELMAKADIALGAGGTTAWERCFMGLPAITVQIAQNQEDVLTSLASSGVSWNLGWHQNVTSEMYREHLLRSLASREGLKEMGSCALSLMTPSAVTGGQSIIDAIMEKQGVNV